MKPRALVVVAALLLVGILAAAIASHVRERFAARRDPGARLPREGLLAAVSSRRLDVALRELREVPVYRRLLGSPTPVAIQRRLGWGGKVPPIPWAALLETHAAAVGVYEQGWVVIGPAGELRAEGALRVEGDGWHLVASAPPLLDLRAATSPSAVELPGGGEVRLEADLRALATRLRRGPQTLLPIRIAGGLTASRGSVRESWTFSCEGGCFLDALSPEGSRGAPSSGWDAMPEEAVAVAWVRLLPERLESFPSGDSGRSEIAERLERIEAFLGLPLRRELARSLTGTAVVALLGEPGEGEPRLLAAFDLLHPQRASRPLDRLAALGLLTESVRVRSYRGVRVTSWSSGSRRGGWEPAVAVDGGVLLLATRRSDLEDALDRRRDGRRGGTEPDLRRRVEALPHGSWKSWSRSSWVLWSWEAIVTGPSSASPSVPGLPCEASLAFDGRSWTLEGGGGGPALGAEFLIPCLRRVLRGGPHSVETVE